MLNVHVNCQNFVLLVVKPSTFHLSYKPPGNLFFRVICNIAHIQHHSSIFLALQLDNFPGHYLPMNGMYCIARFHWLHFFFPLLSYWDQISDRPVMLHIYELLHLLILHFLYFPSVQLYPACIMDLNNVLPLYLSIYFLHSV